MKRIAISLSLVMSLLFPVAYPASATEKCLAIFADSEWANGTPASVKSLLGFELVEKITKTPLYDGRYHPYFQFGQHISTITYNYVGKNCLSRDIKISQTIDAQSVTYEFQTLSDYIDKNSSDFVQQQNSIKFFSDVKDYFSVKTISLKTKQLMPGDLGGSMGTYQLLRSMRKDLILVPPRYAFVYFPTKCAYQKLYDVNGNPTKEKRFSFFVGGRTPPPQVIMNFEVEGECVGVLMEAGYDQGNRTAGVAEKITDIKYFVNLKSSTTSITCKKGSTSRTIKGKNPKCPRGFTKV
jgi:hypothetical protein